ncbi:MAG: hypothetical protein UW46_C0004G0001 [Candidatus Yanofskybacteria bacterium GW2011_GWF1_44_227]|nr:MAG: hypothetical protein UW46_C0004G0001 [Candidatus Yanofskybacteria bacterium GW2011_GWF1_44_227]
MNNIRNFCIIAHIDHGKSTLADRFLELTGTVEKRKMHEQYLDTMDLERERGITIKLQPVRMNYRYNNEDYILNLIDTPGHVDFSYEVSRSLAAVEGAVLLVDATKGVQAQTLANLHLAQQQGLKIIPVINKIDLPNEKLRALVFDSTFDAYKGVIAFIRVFAGSVKRGDKVMAYATRAHVEVLESGYFSPSFVPGKEIHNGETGYIATGLKDPGQIRVGDTITIQADDPSFIPLAGYKEPRPMVFASFFPESSDDFDLLKDALSKLKLTDASLNYEPEASAGLGRGFRVGFLGMLHVEIISERLRREFGLSLIISTPSVEYAVKLTNGEGIRVRSAAMLPDFSRITELSEPVVDLEIIAPAEYLGSVMELVATYRNTYKATDYIGRETALIKYRMPLAEIITDFYDKLKSVSSGYASMSYEPSGMEEGRYLVAKLKTVVPPQWFQVTIQAAIGSKIIAREDIRARRKDVTGYLYGGDITRKMKLLEKQKKGKKKMKESGKVNLPQEVFLKMLKR